MTRAAIVHTNSLYIEKTYSSVNRAKAAMKRAKRWDKVTPKYPEAEYQVMTLEEYREADVMVETYNLLNPKAGPIMIRKSQKNTCCDPGTERYHSM
jgi:hypothetical protein